MSSELAAPAGRVRSRASWTRAVVAVIVVAAAALGIAVGPTPAGSTPARAASCPWVGSTAPVATRVAEVMAQITQAQELALVDGGSGSYAGNIPAISALCIPSINLEDGPQGVGDGQCCVTQLPAPVAAASTWDTSLEQQYGTVVGSEEAGKGANVNLGPTINIVRDPRWGRAFESFGEDPYLSGQMAAAYVTGVQSQGIMDQVKHYAVYNNETNRNNSSDDDVVQERAEQEIYMPAFQAAVNAGVDSAMCAYSQPNGVPACQNFYLLGSLDNELGFQGFVTSDWYATQSTQPSLEAGDDMDMPGDDNYGTDLAAEIGNQVPRDYLDDAVERILTELFNSNIMNTGNTGCTCNTVTSPAHTATALQVAEEGTVLLKNSGSILPLNPSTVGSIAVIGTDASSSPAYSGGGSASTTASNQVTPLAGIQAAAGAGVTVTYNDGTNQASAVAAAQAAHVAVIFADYTESEGSDLTSIDLGTADDDLISAVAAANPNTIVVLNTGSAVTMPWANSVSGILEQWYPGQVDGTAAAAILFGAADPSGHLPVTFPSSLSQVPASTAAEFPGANGQVLYNEGIDVGYRWYQSQDLTPEYPFGFGLSYTTFSYSDLSVTGFNAASTATVTATVTNTGSVAGADVAQLYIGDPSSTGEPPRQLKDFQRVSLNPGASTTVSFSVPVHDLTYWAGPGATSYPTAWSGSDPDGGGWTAPAGTYAIGVGDSSANLPLTGSLTLASPVGPDTVSLSTPGPQATSVGSAVSLQMSATDSAAGQTLTYTASGLPGGLSINPSTGAITGTALFSESDVVTVTATDGEAYESSVSFPWNVAAPPVTAPVVPAGSSCNAPAAGESQLDEGSFTASTSTPSGDGAQTAITNAVSGSNSSRFSTDTDQQAGMYYEVNMGSPQTFNQIEMEFPDWATDYAPDYNVEVSSNGSSWTVVASCYGNGSPETATFSTQTAQYVEVVLTTPDPSAWWSISQFLVFAPSGTTTPPVGNCSGSTSGESQLAEAGFTASSPVPASSTGIQNPITNAVDGNTGAGRFTTQAAQAAGDEYIVNMGSAQTFNEIQMAVPDSPTDYASSYSVEVSPNGSAWSVVATCTGTSTPEVVSFPAQTEQYVEVVLNGPTPTAWWSMEYFDVYSAGDQPFGGTAAAVPGTVQAANYDTGGQGVAYNVSSVNGSANSYRSDGVDLEDTADTQDAGAAGGAYDIGWTTAGQWFKYTVDVATAGTYTVALRLSSPYGVTDALHIDNSSGTNLTGPVAVPDTGGFETWTTVDASITLAAGEQTLTVDQDSNGWNFHYMGFTLASADAPYGGTPAPVPGTVEAANYDTGGQGVAYNVSSVNGSANGYRSDGVDLEACGDTGCGYDIGWTAAGQWFKYTVDVATAGTYVVSFRLASPSGVTDGLHLANSSGTDISGPVNVPATGGWQDWTTVTATVTLPAGVQTLTLDQDNGGWNIYYMAFAASA
jgi:beta-glucosidase